MAKKVKRTRSSSVRFDDPPPAVALAARTSPTPVVDGDSLSGEVLKDAPGSLSPRLSSPGLDSSKAVARDVGSVLGDSVVGSEESSEESEENCCSGDDVSVGILKGSDPASCGTSAQRPSPAAVLPTSGKADFPKSSTGNWKNLFKENRSLNANTMLSYVSDISNSSPCVLLEEDAHNEVWKRCLIGYVAGKYPGFLALKSIINRLWKCDATLSIHESGWIVYKFQNEEDKLEVLNKGPYLIYGRPLVLKSMPEFFDFSRFEMSSVPVWIKLPCLPLKCWTSKCLSKIASRIGKPIQCDKLTANMERISYARVLVEVNLMEDLPSSIPIVLPNGSPLEQPIIFESLPLFCRKCFLIGHSTDNCGKQASRTLHGRGKVSQNAPIPVDTSDVNQPLSAAGTSKIGPSPAGASDGIQPSSTAGDTETARISAGTTDNSLQISKANQTPAGSTAVPMAPLVTSVNKPLEEWVQVTRRVNHLPLEKDQQSINPSQDPEICKLKGKAVKNDELNDAALVNHSDCSADLNVAKSAVNSKAVNQSAPPRKSVEPKKMKKMKKDASGGLAPKAYL